MTSLMGARAPLQGQRIGDGLRALRLTVLAFLLLDMVTTLSGPAYGVTGLGPSGVLAGVQMLLCAAGAAATMWNRLRVAVVCCLLVAVLSVLAGGSGEEPWLLLITGVAVGARADRRRFAVLSGCYLAYAAAFAASSSIRNPGSGWGNFWLALGFTALGLAAGLVARRLLRGRDRMREQVRQLERETAEIRAIERTRLADDLQAVVTGGLQAIERQVDAARRTGDLGSLRNGLTQIDEGCRALLGELRALLEVLRRDPGEPEAGPAVADSGVRRWVGVVAARHVRLAVVAIFSVLAGRAVVVHPWPPAVETLVEVGGLLACALAAWRPRLAAACGAATVALSLTADPAGYWGLLPVAQLCLMGALHWPPRRVVLVGGGLAAYCGLLVALGSAHVLDRVLGACYLGVVAIAIGMTARHFVDARSESLRRHTQLVLMRERVEVEERNAVARELHDVVAHQLSLTTMLVMASSASDEPAVLADTLEKAGDNAVAAAQELGTLLHTMRRPEAHELLPTPLVSPTANAEALARRLSENGHHPVLEIDPEADTLDPTTQRTLGRVMQEGTTNILRYAPPHSTCHFTLRSWDGQVDLRIASPLGGDRRTSDLSQGWGLRGIRERVNLTGGNLGVGPSRGEWIVRVTLPASVPASASVAPAR